MDSSFCHLAPSMDLNRAAMIHRLPHRVGQLGQIPDRTVDLMFDQIALSQGSVLMQGPLPNAMFCAEPLQGHSAHRQSILRESFVVIDMVSIVSLFPLTPPSRGLFVQMNGF